MVKSLCVVAAAALLAVSAAAQDNSGFVRAAKRNIAAQMKDPSSVQFRDLYIGRDSDGKLSLCGEINAKNGYGAYAGFRPFVANASALAYFGDQIAEIWPEFCGKKVAAAK